MLAGSGLSLAQVAANIVPGGGAPYVAQAVQFDSSTTFIKRAAGLTGVTSPTVLSYSLWISPDDPLHFGNLISPNLLNYSVDFGLTETGVFWATIAEGGGQMGNDGPAGAVVAAQWQWLALRVDTSAPQAVGALKMFVDGVDGGGV